MLSCFLDTVVKPRYDIEQVLWPTQQCLLTMRGTSNTTKTGLLDLLHNL
ncbi:MAG: palindromic element RPE4 domain-containing protein [Rickettsia conorii subsp. raoultii]